ncbi:hypothetical protein [Tsukamurella tyrosinosolvens]|uniref:hypothetical protein n=1 Tax=Tsukamurella tyrosinosolvens TaxID=57704 RepID=UPI003B75B7E1
MKVSPASVVRAWRAYGIKPFKVESFRFSTAPELVGKVADICGLYLHLPENAIVLCVDEKSQFQALGRAVPILPMQPGRIERRSHDYYRHGATTLFAALDIATGKVTAALKPQHRHQEFLTFLRQIERAYRDLVDDACLSHGGPRSGGRRRPCAGLPGAVMRGPARRRGPADRPRRPRPG